MAKEAIRVVLVGSGSGQEDHYASEISDRKLALKKRPVIAHIKAFFENRDCMALITH